jgi:hypothetical protein
VSPGDHGIATGISVDRRPRPYNSGSGRLTVTYGLSALALIGAGVSAVL